MATRVMVIHYTPPGVIGGVEHVMHEHITLLAAHGVRLQVIAGRAGAPELRAHVIPEIDAAGQENAVIEAELAAGAVTARFHQARRAILQKLTSLAADADFVIVHNAFTLHFSLPLTAALWEIAGRRSQNSVIAWCHDLAWTNPLYLPAMHAGYPWDLLRIPAPNTRYITVSEERRTELEGIWDGFKGSVQVIPNGIDVQGFLRLGDAARDIVERYRLLDRGVVLLLPVRITRRKNIELGLRAVRSLKERGVDPIFLVSGPEAPHHPGRSRSYLAELKTMRDELELGENVIFLADELGSNLDDRTVAELYSVADALLFPSSHEGFGLPILEAGLARLPAVISDIPIFREVGGDQVWRFGLDATADKIAADVLAAVDTRTARLRRRVLLEYRWDVIVDRCILPLLTA